MSGPRRAADGTTQHVHQQPGVVVNRVWPRSGIRLLASGLAALSLTAIGTMPAWAAPASFTISDANIGKPHALASDATRNVYWTATPTGTSIFAIDAKGTNVGFVPLPTKPTDVEALAVWQGRVYVGDIGDAAAKRSTIGVTELRISKYNQVPQSTTFQLSYPDGAHDAASLMVSPKGNLYVVTRGTGAAIYRASNLSSTRVTKLTRVADAPDYVTDATFVSASQVAVRTFSAVSVIDSFTWKTTAAANLPYQSNGQALTTALGDATTLMAGSDLSVAAVSLPTTLATVTAGTSTPPSASPSASAATTSTTAGSTAKKRTGTLIALVLAGAVAIAAGVVVALKRD